MYILGIAGLVGVEPFLTENYPDQPTANRLTQGMDAAAALLCDGEVVAAVSQERFNRQKKSPEFPLIAIDYCLQAGGVAMDDVTHIVGNFHYDQYKALFVRDPIADRYYQDCLSAVAIERKLASRYPIIPAFTPLDHHDCHLHMALATSGFDSCLAIVMDAAGEIGSTSVYHVAEDSIKRLRRYPINNSLGLFYSLVTKFLGFAPNEDEYKIMGLAAFGDADRYAKFFEANILLGGDGDILIPSLQVNHTFADNVFYTRTSQMIAQGLGFDGLNCSMTQRADVSAALQQRFTEALMHIATEYQRRTGLTNVLVSGGCAENCMSIGDMRTSGLFDHIHVSYGSGDEGTALGAALAQSYLLGEPVHIAQQMPFFGPAPQIDQVLAYAKSRNLVVHNFATEAEMLNAAAHDIAADKIVAICNGRMEYGARALGNRSLLANPGNPNNKDRINLAIKKRQNYRPFAPAVLVEDAATYFHLRDGEAYPYMTMLTKVREDYTGRLPAITHQDGTARVQTVDSVHNPAFYHFLMMLKTLTGYGVVLNTSYNVNHQPIVCTEREAIDTLVEMEIDGLYIANARVTMV